MAEVNEDYNPVTTVQKASGDGAVVIGGGTTGVMIGSLLISSLRSKGLAPWDASLDNEAVGLVATVLAALFAFAWRAGRNYYKNKWLTVFVCAGFLGLLLQGCVTTTDENGQVVQQLDTRGLLEVYRLYLEHHDRAPAAGPAPTVEISVGGGPVEIPVAELRRELRLRGIEVPGE